MVLSAGFTLVPLELVGQRFLGTARRAIRPSVFFVIVASLALEQALIDTGATQYVTEVILVFAAEAPPIVVLSSLMLLLALWRYSSAPT